VTSFTKPGVQIVSQRHQTRTKRRPCVTYTKIWQVLTCTVPAICVRKDRHTDIHTYRQAHTLPRSSPSVAAGRWRPPLSIDMSCPRGVQQQTRRPLQRLSNDGTDRGTDRRRDGAEYTMHFSSDRQSRQYLITQFLRAGYPYHARRLYILCWRELSRRRLLPTVSPAAGHLTTPTVAGLPGKL